MTEFEKVSHPIFERKRIDKTYPGTLLHLHSEYELYFLLSGSTKYFMCNEVFALNAGDMLFVPKDTLHHTEYDRNEEVERIVIYVDEELFDGAFSRYLQEMTENKHITFDQHGLLKIADLVNKIEKEGQKEKPGYREMQQLYFQQLLILISRCRNKNKPEVLPASLLLIQRVLDHINQNYAADITLSSLADVFSISPWYLSKSFKSVTGVGIKEYISIARVSAAKTLLQTADLSITEVATKCGFYDCNYFAAVFKRIVGITPKKYSMLNKNK